MAVKAFPSADHLAASVGDEMYALIRDLYPLARSITGQGLRESLTIISNIIDLQKNEVPSGTQVFDWQVPDEWTIRDAYIKDAQGKRVVDYRAHNLHVVNYSTPVKATMSLDELRPRLHTIPDHPDWIPYRTAYYDRDWGFCLAQTVLDKLPDGDYEVCIDAEHFAGSLTYGEFVIAGESEDEVLIFAHACHPSLCNDNLSGLALSAFLGRELARVSTRLSYRFIFAPATIGSITWLAQNEHRLPRIKAGLVLSVIGDGGDLVYKRSRKTRAAIDRAAEHVISTVIRSGDIRDFSPWGYDERQFCSPGINLPVGRLTRTPNGEYPEYHSSADDLSIVSSESLLHSLRAVWSILQVLEGDRHYKNLYDKGEPQLGKRGLYRSLGGFQDVAQHQMAMLWILNQSDGEHSLLDIAMSADIPFSVVKAVADKLIDAELIVESTQNETSPGQIRG